ncbi:MAG: cyclic pyranopterin monophosphate synthase MoaC [Saprospiraceae bacterium]|jgi:cyclic pyranopterin monophosphate synthase|nr:cyclic pyranopterin monophosphate synthase MoaC [Saprospiraceae bacterium]|tara:strand:- start:6292 stop:6771 length:480 start_codon:yes stop_codon:yes gene_type:complete
MEKGFSHLDGQDRPQMVDVGQKDVTDRRAVAQSVVTLPLEIIERLSGEELHTKKGPVFQTAILAGIMAVKKTSELIPLCHPLPMTKCNVEIEINNKNEVVILCEAKTSGKTGVEMEALTGASVAALTIYDMCKGFSHDIIISDIKLLAKSGGKKNFKRQ